MAWTYPFSWHDGHIIVENGGGRLLLDTGSPASIADGPFDFGGRACAPTGALLTGLGASIDRISELVGLPLTALVGTDVLEEHDLLADPVAGTLTAGDGLSLEGDRVPLDRFMGIPYTEATVAGVPMDVFLDTGAKISYLEPLFADEYPSLGEAEDFYPLLGRFTTPLRALPVSLDGLDFTLKAGVLPEVLRTLLCLGGMTGVLGTEVLQDRRFLISLSRLELVLGPTLE